jgi:hypothetical protein
MIGGNLMDLNLSNPTSSAKEEAVIIFALPILFKLFSLES